MKTLVTSIGFVLILLALAVFIGGTIGEYINHIIGHALTARGE